MKLKSEDEIEAHRYVHCMNRLRSQNRAKPRFSEVETTLAIAHFNAEIIGAKRNVVWLASQRHRARMYDELNGCFTGSFGEDAPDFEEITLPENPPQWIVDLVDSHSVAKVSEAIWNKITMGKRANGQLAREITVALPIELSCEQNIALMQEFVQKHIVVLGVVADWVFHNWDENPHARLLHTLRPVVSDGFGPKSIPVLGECGRPLRYQEGRKIVYQTVIGGRECLLALRKAWGNVVNRHLECAGLDTRIDVRSYEEQGIDKVPGKHVGRAKLAMSQRRRDRLPENI
ncbi:hypothetical protein CQ054_21270 [Ochrobactrum sp. MYb29]|nr:hypothetical protein CQ054_21270 [Ochrobactrum sp. MYb29]